MSKPQIVWHRRDLRLADQPALTAAAEAGPIVPVYVLDDDRPGTRKFGGAHRWWLHHSLASLARSYGAHHAQLTLRRGDAVAQIAAIAAATGAGAVHAMHHYERWWAEAEAELADALPDGCELCLHDGNYLLPPGTVTTNSGDPYKIYTPFAKSLMQHMPPRDALPAPSHVELPDEWPETDALEDWNLLPRDHDWSEGFRDFWKVGEDAGHDRIDAFAEQVDDYERRRNLPSEDGTSFLSPHLHWGEVTPVQIWHKVSEAGAGGEGWQTFAGEVVWRDFTQNVIAQFPDYPERSYRDTYDGSLWRDPEADDAVRAELKAWQQGRTGYPIVDAGMRQLWHIGWMHNRVRMIAASFLCKHLLIDWRHGERWYWDCLVDGDYGNNGVNWQWISGTGVDANMFSRIMAPLSQSDKFHAGDYIRQWVPELADLGDDAIHDPTGDARPDVYPDKLIGHAAARERALSAYHAMKGD